MNKKPNKVETTSNKTSFIEDLKHKYLSRFEYYKQLGDKTIARLSDEEIHWSPSVDSNNMVILVKHMSGNMLSRWTDFLESDGEKSWRNRDGEFVDDNEDKEHLIRVWEKGWKCLFDTIGNLSEDDFHKNIWIRNESHTVTDAINRQLAHYAYHIGQMVFVGIMIKGENWESLSIPKNTSTTFNRKMYSDSS